ncbi:hypothetical protein LCI18_001831 [Fusarium solani-melongenae]|uniref:Uncharacterized protein n=1 Tax=Fusarium solani subsp. cucurbitae TaxID=2747967 RepID=A0ACD3YPL7_FUSSC|nr:hypothetical protein LCI18_001831 [Fusarium solani-melongenae]
MQLREVADGGQQATWRSTKSASMEYTARAGKPSTSDKFQVQGQPRSSLGIRNPSWRGSHGVEVGGLRCGDT